MALTMPAVWTDRHRGHAPNGGYWLGVREVGDEEPERGDTLHDQLHDSRCDDRRRTGPRPRSDHGRARRRSSSTSCRAVHRMGRRGPSRRPWAAAGGAVPVRVGGLRGEIRPGLAPGDHPRRGRPVCDGHHVAHQRGDVRGRLRRRPRRGPRQRSRARWPAGGVCGSATAWASRRSRLLRRFVLLQQRRRSRPATARRGRQRVAIVDIDAHQGNGTQEIFWERADVLYASVHVDPAAGWFPHLVGHAHEIGGGDGGEQPQCSDPAGIGRRLGSLRSATCAEAVRQHGAGGGGLAGRRCRRRRPGRAAAGHRRRFRGAGRSLALGVPTVFVQEGGYDLPRLGRLVLAVLEGFEGTSWLRHRSGGWEPTSSVASRTPGDPTSAPAHWRLEVVAATERPRQIELSPDGSTLAFMLDRDTSDVWTVPVSGRTPSVSPPADRWRRSGRTATRSGRPTARGSRTRRAGGVVVVAAGGGVPRGRVRGLGAGLAGRRASDRRCRPGRSHRAHGRRRRRPWPRPVAEAGADYVSAVVSPDRSVRAYTVFHHDDLNCTSRCTSSRSPPVARTRWCTNRASRYAVRRGRPTAPIWRTPASGPAGTRCSSSTRPARAPASAHRRRGRLRGARWSADGASLVARAAQRGVTDLVRVDVGSAM